MSIIVNQLSKIYGQQKAVDQISFQITPGEIVGFLGPNGAGKSTTMKMLTTYIPPTSGNATVAGFDIYSQQMEIKKAVGYLPESNPLYYDMYVTEYLNFVAAIHKLKNIKDKVAEVILKTGLTKEVNKKIGTLSKGYKQRVGIAQAIIHDPKVLILDEPTSGLDPNQIEEIRNLIVSIGKDKAVMLSTHIMQEVEAMCNRIIIINEGKIVKELDFQKEGQSLNKDKQALQIIFNTDIESIDWKGFGAMNGWEINQANKNEIIILTDDLALAKKKLMELALQNNLEINSFQEHQDSLETIFKQATQQKKGK